MLYDILLLMGELWTADRGIGFPPCFHPSQLHGLSRRKRCSKKYAPYFIAEQMFDY